MIKFRNLTLSHYDLGNDLYDWWYNSSYHAWEVDDGYYLSNDIYSYKNIK